MTWKGPIRYGIVLLPQPVMVPKGRVLLHTVVRLPPRETACRPLAMPLI